MKIIKIGVIGITEKNDPKNTGSYYGTVFTMLSCMQNMARKKYGNDVVFELVFGLTDVGVNQCVHDIATNKWKQLGDMKTIGFACSKSSEFPRLLTVDEKHIVGAESGDESEPFVDFIDALLKIGGGDKETKEWDMFTTKYPDKLCYDATYLL